MSSSDWENSADPMLSIIMPCLNEAETLEQCIAEAIQGANNSGVEAEVLVADNGSTDGSLEIARRCGVRVVTTENRGYGSAVRCGIENSRGQFVLMGDADASYDFSIAPEFLTRLRSGADLVIGNRFQGGIEKNAMPWKHRYIGNPILSGIGRLFFRCSVGDFHCGLRAFRRDSIEALCLRAEGMEFATEMIVKARINGMRIEEIPTVLRKDGRSRSPHLRSWRDGWRHLRFLLLHSPSWLFIAPGLLLAALGSVSLVILATLGPLNVGSATLSINCSLISAMVVLVGYQIVLQGVFARLYGNYLGIWPSTHLERLSKRFFSLEIGLAFAALLVGCGLSGIYAATLLWVRVGFSDLEPSVALSLVIPSMTVFMLGAQTCFASFFHCLLSLGKTVN